MEEEEEKEEKENEEESVEIFSLHQLFLQTCWSVVDLGKLQVLLLQFSHLLNDTFKYLRTRLWVETQQVGSQTHTHHPSNSLPLEHSDSWAPVTGTAVECNW